MRLETYAPPSSALGAFVICAKVTRLELFLVIRSSVSVHPGGIPFPARNVITICEGFVVAAVLACVRAALHNVVSSLNWQEVVERIFDGYFLYLH